VICDYTDLMLAPLVTLFGHEDDTRVWHAAWSSSGSHLATCGEDKVICIWTCKDMLVGWENAENIVCLATLEEGQTRTVRSCEWSPDGRMIASASFDGTIVIWESQSSARTHWDQIASLEGHDNEVKCVAWSSDGRWLASCGRDKRVWIWEKLGASEFECVAM
jgi:WD40 repeat protein